MIMDKAKEISKDYADHHTCYASDPKLQYLYTRKAVEFGYHQAEKDLELTWEDIPEIFRISEQLKTSWWFRDNGQTKKIGTQVFWEEVLERFKERKAK